MWWAYVGTLSDFGTLFWHNTTTRLPTPALYAGIFRSDFYINIFYSLFKIIFNIE